MTSFLSRRQSLQGLAHASSGAHISPALLRTAAAETVKDEDIFQFALNLEYMETEYYL
ncbi:MAG: hypothetical protein K0R53_3406, partial [Burkholderiales bacterium]|nr:hypothetical protein [Burkholderiales bacterium]